MLVIGITVLIYIPSDLIFSLQKNNPIDPFDIAQEDPARKTEILSSTWQVRILKLG